MDTPPQPAASGHAAAQQQGTPQPSGKQNSQFPRWIVPLLIAAFTFVTYSASLYFGFVYDDRVQILNNSWLDWSYVSRFFSESTGAFTGNPEGSYWRPLFLLWMLINHSIFGLQPWGWHLTTVALHCIVAVLVYAVAMWTLKDRFLAAFAALLFGVYPVTVESVAWIAGVTDPLMAVFLLSSFLVYLKAWELQSRHVRALSLILFVFALLVKETAVILSLLVLVHSWLYRSQLPEHVIPASSTRNWTVVRSFLPYAAFTGIYVVERSLVLSPGPVPPEATGATAMVLSWSQTVWFYLRLLFIPNVISPHYNLHAQTEFSIVGVLLPGVGLLGLAAAGIWLLRRLSSETRRQVTFSLAWIFFPLVPVLYIERMAPGDFAHLRYLYLSVIGLAMLVAIAIRGVRGSQRVLNKPVPQVAIAVMLLLGSALLTLKNQLYWQNNFTLFAHAVEIAPENARARTNYAVELGERKQLEESVAQFQKALEIEPDLWYANIDLGFTYYLMGRYDEAIRWMEKGTKLNPRDANQYTFLSAAQIRAGRLEAAAESMRQAIARAPDTPNYHVALGLILEKQGKLEESRQAFQQELEIDPSNALAQEKLNGPAAPEAK